MLIAYIVLFVIISGTGFYYGMKCGKEKSKNMWENEIRYVTIKDLENIIGEMRSNGDGDDTTVVIMYADWWGENI